MAEPGYNLRKSIIDQSTSITSHAGQHLMDRIQHGQGGVYNHGLSGHVT